MGYHDLEQFTLLPDTGLNVLGLQRPAQAGLVFADAEILACPK
jgi:hypothetical protein